MIYYKLDAEPTQEQLDDVNGTMLDGVLTGEPGYYYVEVPDETEIPEWLAAGELLNMPGEPMRCPTCGELI